MNVPLRPRQVGSAWPRVRLGEIADHRLGKMLDKAKNTGVPRRYLRNPNVRWFDIDLSDLQEILVEEKDVHKYELQSGDVVICEGGEAGRAALWKNEAKGIIFQKAIHRVRVGPKLDARFLIHRLMFDYFNGGLEDYYTGATIKHFTGQDLARYEIPLPPLDEQRRIATILDKADALRRKRNRTLDLLDGLPQSIFLEMFGDPRSNPKSWPKQPLQQLGTVHTGKTPPTSDPKNFGNDVPFLTPADLESRSPPSRFVSTLGATFLRAVPPGAALVCCIGATIGKMDIADTRSTFNQQINAVEWGKNIMSEFGITALRFCKDEIINRALSTTLPILKKSEFQKLEIIVPPMTLQRDFSNHAQYIARLRSRVISGVSGFDLLFSSLQHRAFSGQL